MKRNDLLTPEGTRDLLFDECIAKRSVEENIRKLFEQYGFAEVRTTGLEFFDVFNKKARYFPQETMYKLVDAKNRLMVLRPDNTMPIARLVSTRLRDEVFPLKLFYNQSVFMVNPKNSGRDDEFTQSGIEIIGGDNKRSDFEALALAAEALKTCGSEEFRLEIGDSGFFRELISKLDIDEEESEEIRSYIENKNYPALNAKLEEIGDNDTISALKALPHLFGGIEVFDKAEDILKDGNLCDILESVREVYNNLCALGLSDNLTVDFGLVQKKNYYTGILFRGYISGYGAAVLSGGRYDTLVGDFGADMPAVGFAVNVEAVSKVLLKQSDTPLLKSADVLVFAYDGAFVEAMRHSSELISDGKKIENAAVSDEDEAVEYAKAKGIKRIDFVSFDEIKTILIK